MVGIKYFFSEVGEKTDSVLSQLSLGFGRAVCTVLCANVEPLTALATTSAFIVTRSSCDLVLTWYINETECGKPC